jgi:hypothetical protein
VCCFFLCFHFGLEVFSAADVELPVAFRCLRESRRVHLGLMSVDVVSLPAEFPILLSFFSPWRVQPFYL